MLAKTNDTDLGECRFTGRVLTKPREGSSWEGFKARIAARRQHGEDGRQWFVLLCEPNMERKAQVRLVADGFKVYLPEGLVWTTRGVRRRKMQVAMPLFRGYLFVRLGFHVDEGRFQRAAATIGVHKYLRLDDDYAIVPDEAMRLIGLVSEALMIPKEIRGPSAIFEPGEHVRVSEGPFSGINADIVRLDDAERITVLLSLLGRAVKVQLQAEQLEKL